MEAVMRSLVAALLGMTILFSFSAFAQEETKPEEPAKAETPAPAAKPPGDYSPANCEFSITFPETPHAQKRCEPAPADKKQKPRCYEQASYIKVFDMVSSVNIRATCNPVEGDMYGQYSGDVMKATLKAMIAGRGVEAFDASYREDTHYKQAGLVGEGKQGLSPTLYIAQLWIGRKSVLTVEAEMVGEPHPAADALFSQILKSAKYVEGKAVAGPETENGKTAD